MFQNVSLQNKSGHFFQDGPACTDKENSKNLLTIRHKKIVDNPQDNNDSEDEDNAIDLEADEGISQRVLLQ